ncbi:MAG: hypothetical protein QOE70_1558 [Chthoniobacter sp.]|jgi:hypothetical protein|nr:hypothetical protein [Chthoniobacter sp.]
MKRHLLTGLAAIALVAPAWAANAISATLDPTRVALGDSAQLTVTMSGQQTLQPRMPEVDGLDITPAGQSTTMQVINGAVSANASYQFNVTPQRAGTFTIPAIAAGGAKTQPIGLRVDPDSGGRAPQPRAQSRSHLPAPTVPGDDSAVEAKGQHAFLRVVLPKQSLYVGELVPVQVKAYFRAGMSASLNGLPVLSSDAFTLAKLGERPAQTEEIIDGQVFTVLTWDSTLSAVKAGDYPLNLDLPVMMRVKERGKRGGRNPFKDFFGDNSPFGGSMFDDSMFDDFFGGVTEKPLTLHTDGATVKIQAPPANGRPANFSGAVGDFDVTAETTTTTASAGDPLTLKIKVTGKGNFDRVSLAGLEKSASWKSYKPSAKFEPADSAGFSGTKTFEQAVIPAKVGTQEIPALSFSYFNPSTGKYVTKRTEPIAINVAVADPTKPAAPAPASSDSDSAAQAPTASANEPVATKVQASPIASLHPLVLRPWFILVNGAMLAALAAVTLVRRVSASRARDPQRLAREAAEKSVRESLAQMDAAVKDTDAPTFFLAARHVVQQRLAKQWHLPASEAAISQRLNGEGEDLRTLFRTADEATYTGRHFTAAELREWHDTVTQQLQRIPTL